MATRIEDLLGELDRQDRAQQPEQPAAPRQPDAGSLLAELDAQQIGPVRGFFGGANQALARALGAPVDLVTSAINFIGEQRGPRQLAALVDDDPETTLDRPGAEPGFRIDPTVPLGGSASFERLFSATGSLLNTEFENLPRAARIGFRAGETFGGAVPFAIAPFAAGTRVPAAVQPIVTAARTRPRQFLATEAATTAGAAQGAAIAEAALPGDPTARLTAEVIGGFANPAAALSRLTGTGQTGLARAIGNFSRAGRENRAAEILQSVVTEFGEDPEALARTLRLPDLPGVRVTAGQRSGSQALLAIESRIAQRDVRFAGEAANRARESTAMLLNNINELAASGDPQALRLAARLRLEQFDDTLTRRFEVAEREAAEAAARLRGPGARDTASSETFDIISDALSEARTTERQLWALVPQDVPLRADNLARARDAVRTRLLQEETIPLQRTLDRVLAGETTSGELLRIRNRALARARDLSAQRNFSEASQFREIADGALGDLDAIEGVLRTVDVPVFQQARDFSRTLNDSFSRTFAGQALSTASTGAPRIPPETLLDRAFGGGGPAAAVRFRQLQEAGQFGDEAVRRGAALTEETFDSPLLGQGVRNQQEAFLRDLSRRVTREGVVDPNLLRQFMQNNPTLLQGFPDLARDLSDAGRATELFRQVEAANRTASQAVRQRTAFSRVANTENPAGAITSVLRGQTPVRDFNQLARLARTSGPGAVAGLRVSALDHASNVARRSGGQFSFQRFNDALTERIARGQPSLLTLMRRNNVISAGDARRLQQLTSRAIQIEDAVRSGARLDELVGEPDALFDFVTRVIGAQVGAASVVGQASGAPLVAAGAGSRLARNLFERVPATRITDVLREAAENPRFAATLLERARTPAQRGRIERQINAFLLQAALIPDE